MGSICGPLTADGAHVFGTTSWRTIVAPQQIRIACSLVGCAMNKYSCRRLLSTLSTALVLLSLVGANFAQEPSASAATTPRVDVNVTSFGADPTGKADSAQAVKAAIKRVKRLSNQGKATRLVFPTGTYQLYPEHAEVRELYVSNTVGANQTYRNKTIAMLAEGVHDVIIDGQGSRLTMHGQLPQLILAISLSAISPPTGLPPPASST